MTDMQIKYWDLMSQKNLRESQALKAEAERKQVLELLPEQKAKLINEAEQAYQEIQLTMAKTDLTQVQKQEAVSKIVNNYIDSAKDVSSEIRQWVKGSSSKGGGGSQGLGILIQLLGAL